jgi:hypothetical protein
LSHHTWADKNYEAFEDAGLLRPAAVLVTRHQRQFADFENGHHHSMLPVASQQVEHVNPVLPQNALPPTILSRPCSRQPTKPGLDDRHNDFRGVAASAPQEVGTLP